QAVGYTTDYNDVKRLAPVSGARMQYRALAEDLAAVPVPASIAPLYLTLINDLAAMGADTTHILAVLQDPLRGLAGLQRFNAAGSEASRVLTTIGGVFPKNGILFSADEPGVTWAAFLASTQTQTP